MEGVQVSSLLLAAGEDDSVSLPAQQTWLRTQKQQQTRAAPALAPVQQPLSKDPSLPAPATPNHRTQLQQSSFRLVLRFLKLKKKNLSFFKERREGRNGKKGRNGKRE